MTPAPKENYELVLYRLDQIDSKLDTMRKNYVTKDEFESFKEEVKKDLERRNLASWLNPVIASVTTALITFLAIQYLQNYK